MVSGKYMRRIETRWVEKDYDRIERMREHKEIKKKKKMLADSAEAALRIDDDMMGGGEE